MTDLKALLARVEGADGFDSELDRDIGFALAGWKYAEPKGYPEQMIYVPDEASYYVDHPGANYPSFTDSIDAALALVEKVLGKHWLWQLKRGIECEAIIWMLERDYDDEGAPAGYHADSMPLAILAALLKAKIAEQPTDITAIPASTDSLPATTRQLTDILDATEGM